MTSFGSEQQVQYSTVCVCACVRACVRACVYLYGGSVSCMLLCVYLLLSMCLSCLKIGIREGYWGWGNSMFDFNNDRWVDFIMTNGR